MSNQGISILERVEIDPDWYYEPFHVVVCHAVQYQILYLMMQLFANRDLHPNPRVT